MANDPAFLFYPGDYLRDTQCLSEKTQVAYDRIMCEHMRNICISKQQLNFFIKRLSEDEKTELFMVLKKSEQGYQIHWVAESIEKRRVYSESRRNNRVKKEVTYDKDMKTYDEHMDNENEIVNEDIDKTAFEQIWESYPVKKGRKVAERHFKASVKTKQDLTDLKGAIESYKNEIVRNKTEERFIKHGSTFFNNWRDYVPVEQPVQKPKFENLLEGYHP